MYPDSVDPYSKIRYNSDGTIVVTDDWTNKGHQSIPKYYRPNAVLETVSPNGQHDRTINGKDGWFTTQIHGGDYCKSKQHPFGIHGEHAHDYYIDPIAKSVKRTTRELTPIERIQHADIIGGVTKMTVKQFKEIMEYNEPDFGYRGEEYSICWPNGIYYVTASDNPQDQELSFSSVDEMLDHWIIQGKPLREILPEIDLK